MAAPQLCRCEKFPGKTSVPVFWHLCLGPCPGGDLPQHRMGMSALPADATLVCQAARQVHMPSEGQGSVLLHALTFQTLSLICHTAELSGYCLQMSQNNQEKGQ